MRKVILLRSNQILSDSRVEKYLSFYKEKNIDYQIVAWDRLNTGVVCENTTYYRRKVGYVVGGIKAAYNRIFWFVFIIRTLCKMKEKPTFIHACDLDTAFPAAVYKTLFNKKVYLIFDVFDWMSHTLSSNAPKPILYITERMEHYTLKRSDKIIICEEERKRQIRNPELYDIIVLPNIPMVKDVDEIKKISDEYKFDNKKLTLSYVGWFGHARFLEELLDVAERGLVNLLIAGYGNKALEDKCNMLNEKDNVKYFGRVPYGKGLEIMYNSDAIYAMYCKVSSNHYFAAPNKYYEVMLLGKPIITTKGIIIGDKVEKDDIGYTIEESIDDLIALITNISQQEMDIKGENAKTLWDNKYSTYTHDFLENKYLPLINL
ncbi:MAG: glycosyltransferase [Tidjanibacter sp.]|nr:glycosyltransferase [Tidjanibacter sp.]